jgi:hypothetical protein
MEGWLSNQPIWPLTVCHLTYQQFAKQNLKTDWSILSDTRLTECRQLNYLFFWGGRLGGPNAFFSISDYRSLRGYRGVRCGLGRLARGQVTFLPSRIALMELKTPAMSATEYRAKAAEHHRLAGMCRSPESRERHFQLERDFLALAEAVKRTANSAQRSHNSGPRERCRSVSATNRACSLGQDGRR